MCPVLSENWLVARLATVYVEAIPQHPAVGHHHLRRIRTIHLWPLSDLPRILGVLDRRQQLPNSEQQQLGNTGYCPDRESDCLLDHSRCRVDHRRSFVWRWRSRRFDATGQPHHRVLWSIGCDARQFRCCLPTSWTGTPLEMSWPVISDDRRLFIGGFAMNWGFISLTVASESSTQPVISGRSFVGRSSPSTVGSRRRLMPLRLRLFSVIGLSFCRRRFASPCLQPSTNTSTWSRTHRSVLPSPTPR